MLTQYGWKWVSEGFVGPVRFAEIIFFLEARTGIRSVLGSTPRLIPVQSRLLAGGWVDACARSPAPMESSRLRQDCQRENGGAGSAFFCGQFLTFRKPHAGKGSRHLGTLGRGEPTLKKCDVIKWKRKKFLFHLILLRPFLQSNIFGHLHQSANRCN